MNPTRRSLALAAAALMTGLLVGCATTPTPMPMPMPIADAVAAAPQLSTLNRLIADAGLTETLRGTGPYTLFAPSDEAFKAVPAKALADLAADKALLKSILSFHLLPGKLSSAEAKNGNLKSVQGANLAVSKAGTFVTVEDAVVQQADLPATNGVIHVIDKVLMPPNP